MNSYKRIEGTLVTSVKRKTKTGKDYAVVLIEDVEGRIQSFYTFEPLKMKVSYFQCFIYLFF